MPKDKKAPRGKAFEPGNKWRFKPGESGNPGGRPQKLDEAYAKALTEVDPKSGLTVAEILAQTLVLKALNGDREALIELRRATAGDTLNTPDLIQIVMDR